MSYLPPGTFIAVTLVFTGILIFETIRYAIKVKRGEIGKQSWLYAMPAFIFCAIFAAVERFFRAYIPGPVSDVLSKIQLFLPLLAFVSLWCALVWGLKRGYIEQKYRKTVTVGVTLLPIMTLIFYSIILYAFFKK